MIKIIPPRNSKTNNLYIRGSYLGIPMDKSCRTDKRSIADVILKRLKGQIERGEYPPAGDDREQHGQNGVIYFAECGDYIKVGFTASSVDRRLRALRTASPYPINVLAIIEGTQRTESNVHARFAKSFHRGEWFRKTPELLDYIESIKEHSAREAA